MGHRADILTRRIIDPAWPEFEGETDSYPGHPNVRILRIPCGPDRFLPKVELWPYLKQWTDRIAQRYTEEGGWPDLWTGHYADGGLSAALLQEASGVPFTFTAHSLGAWKLDSLIKDFEDSSDGIRALDDGYNFGARIQAERTAISRSAAVITNSSVERLEEYDHPAYRDVADPENNGRFTVVPPGVNTDIFSIEARSPWEEEVQEKIECALARDILPERRGLPAVIAWSRLDPKKNHLALMRAFVRRPALREKANLVMITRGLDDPLRDPDAASREQQPVLEALISEIEQNGLRGCVSAFSLAGQTTLAALYRWGVEVGGAFCLPAEHEPFGMTVIEAMAVGLPVVATRNGGPREITDNGRAGLLADPYDPEEIGGQLLRLISDGKTWQTCAERGLERATKHYNWHRTAENYLHLAREILGNRPERTSSLPLPGFVRGSTKLPRLQTWTTARKERIG